MLYNFIFFISLVLVGFPSSGSRLSVLISSSKFCEWTNFVSKLILWVKWFCEWTNFVTELILWVNWFCEWTNFVSELILWVNWFCEWTNFPFLSIYYYYYYIYYYSGYTKEREYQTDQPITLYCLSKFWHYFSC